MFPMLNQTSYAQGIEIHGPITSEYAEILTPVAMSFVATLVRAFSSRREELLQLRARRQVEIDAGKMPDFLPETAHIREGNWTVAPLPSDLQDRRVEITGPVERKMIINALAMLSIVPSALLVPRASNTPYRKRLRLS